MLLVNVDKASKQSLQEQIIAQILVHIENGVLETGAKLPSSRMLAKELKLSRNTVMNAYQRLISEGYIETVEASETRVCSILPENLSCVQCGTSSDTVEIMTDGKNNHFTPVVFTSQVQDIVNKNDRRLDYDFWVGRPHHKLFPSKIWQNLLLECINYSTNQMAQYGNPAGYAPLREAIAEHVRYTRAVPATADQIVITVGIQEALNIISRLFITNGFQVLVENPCYQGAAFVFKSYGAKLLPIGVDADGLKVDELPEIKGSLIYITPSHQYPLGVTLSLERRVKLIEWAERNGSYIIEDDYDSDFRYDSSPLHAVSGLSHHGHSIYLGTFSKSVAAGLRIGYMVLPQQLIKPAIAVKTLLNNHNGWLDQAVMAKFIQEGHFERHLRLMRKEYETRRDVLVTELKRSLGGFEITGEEGGMHIAITMPEGTLEAEDLQRIALSKGVGIYTLNSGGSVELVPTQDSSRKIILGYSSLDVDDIKEGVKRISALLREPW